MAGAGGFDHNAQSLRVVTRIEGRYAAFDGLNLTWETLEGIAKHNGPLTDREGNGIGRYRDGLPHAIRVHSAQQDLELWSHASAEAQVAAISDDIAYDVHDLDDGLRARMFTLDDIAGLPLVGEALASVRGRYPGLDVPRTVNEVLRLVITLLIEDVVAESTRRAQAAGVASAEDVRALGAPIVAFSDAMRQKEKALKGFLFPRMYRHERVQPHHGRGAGGHPRSVRLFHQPPEGPAALLAGRYRDAGRRAPRPPRLRLHRGHDRPLRPRPTTPASATRHRTCVRRAGNRTRLDPIP